MVIDSLTIDNFRNLQEVKLNCSARLNLIIGANASGKTSLLEAIYFLGRARSFRTTQPRELIRDGAATFQVVARMASTKNTNIASKNKSIIGIERGMRDFTARVDGSAARSLAELAARVPVLMFNPDSHYLIGGSPQQRRRFMDWGVFHREPSFFPAWQRYRVALKHRNAALRNHAADRLIDAWDDELCTNAHTLDTLRQSFCEALQAMLAPLSEITLGKAVRAVEYRRGWSQEHDLQELIRLGRNQDRQYGYTRSGPHRADFAVRLQDQVTEQLSRGQQKLLAIALLLAQARLFEQLHDEACILLFDDLAAELDAHHRSKVIASLLTMQTQLFITAIESNSLAIDAGEDLSCFAIDHGALTKMV